MLVSDDGKEFKAGSRTRWIEPGDDNYGFAAWVHKNQEALLRDLGPGHHFGEWWGQGVQRKYNLTEKRFSLFNTHRWAGYKSDFGMDVVPVIYQGMNTPTAVEEAMEKLRVNGSFAAPGFMSPEGICVFHTGNMALFKKTFEKDQEGKGQ